MKNKPIRYSHIFNLLAISLILVSYIMYFYYNNTKDKIYNANHMMNIEYVENITENIIKDIKRVVKYNIAETIHYDLVVKNYIKSDLELFVTTKYKYLYLVSKGLDEKYHILVSSSSNINENTQLVTPYENKNIFNKIYETQDSLYLEKKFHDDIAGVYMKPLIIDDRVESIIVVGFSLKEQKTIANELDSLQNVFKFVVWFFISIFSFLLWFAYMDKKREKEKEKAFEALENLNLNLESKIKKALSENEAQHLHMLQQSKLAQMGEMISMIAHQWRQPLSAISATSSTISIKAQFGKLDDELAIELSDKISGYVKHLSITIDDFRDFFNTTKVKKETTFNEIISDVLKIIEVSIKNKNIKIIKDLQYEDKVYIYANEIKQVILNLIKNSEDALIDRDEIDKKFIKIITYKEDDNFIFEISDNGGGISENIIDKIFEPYFSTKIQKDGTGLGLYMSKTIIEKHCDGKLIVSNNNGGAVFKIILKNIAIKNDII